MPHVAFIGLGRMGHGMAARYLDVGFTLAVWNRSRDKADDLIARGARRAESPADAARNADAIVTMVADDAASQLVWTGRDGITETARNGALAIECSTVSYRHVIDMARDLTTRGLRYIDCPVTGLPEAASAGKLTLLVGADADNLEAARPFLAPLGETIRHFGAVGAGTVFKLINNLMGAVQIASLAEGLRIAEQAGLDMRLVQQSLASGAVASPQVVRHSARMVARDFAGASFTTALRHKDASYAIALAESLGLDLTVAGAAVDTYARAAADMPDDDEGRLIDIINASPVAN
ncbi:MAG: NAD(P)-dependent oxidoreductase [Rhizobiales bacterium]|nr:NAD(P)-dependent oxidoreductase [Hyphomicrobiales bacterium]